MDNEYDEKQVNSFFTQVAMMVKEPFITSTHNDMANTYKYFAFISYNSKDTAWGKRLQRKLENYRMPSALCSEHGWKHTPLNPIFFAPTDIQPGGLTAELQERLKASRNLIVICSPNSAKSEWVGKEIEFFHSLGRTDHIHFFIVDGKPHSGNKDTECFNPIVDTLGMPEILGVNIHEKISRWSWVNKERAYVQLITKLLGVEFDSIWQRHKRMMIQQIVAWAAGIVTVLVALLGVWAVNQPVDVKVSLNETSVHNDNLPPLKDAIVTLAIDNESKTDTLSSIEDLALFANIPHSAIGKEAHILIECKDWLTTDTTILRLSKDIVINIERDSRPYGNVTFKLWDANKECGVSNVKINIMDAETSSDAEGDVIVFIPLDEQRTEYKVTCSIPLQDNTIYMPMTKSTVMLTK